MSAESDLYKNLLDQLQACATQEERDWLALRFTLEQQLPKPLRAAVQAAAVPRFFDRAFLNALLDQPLDEAQFAELTGLSYIEPYPGEGRFNVHERSRKLLQEKLWQEDEALYREISRRAFAYCKKQDQNVLTWRIETVYHQLVAEPEEGLASFKISCVKWMSPSCFANNKAESLLQAVREHLEFKRLQEQAVYWFWLNQARVDRVYLRFKAVKYDLQQIPWNVQGNHCLTVGCLKTLGHSHRYLSELREARKCYEAALILHREAGNKSGEAECFMRFGEINLCLSEFSQAKNNYSEALILYRNLKDQAGEADCLKFIGHVHLHLAEYQKAQLFYEKALKIYRSNSIKLGEADCLRTIGDTYRSLGMYPKAQRYCEEALQLYRDIDAKLGEANSLKSLGQVLLKKSDLSNTQTCYEKSLRIYKKLELKLGEADCLRLFGDLAVQIGDWIDARQYYEKSLALSEEIQRSEGVAECWEGFAKLHQAQQQFPQAEGYWQKAADMYHKLAMPLREQHCLEQGHQMKEQKQSADVRHEVSDKQTPPADV